VGDLDIPRIEYNPDNMNDLDEGNESDEEDYLASLEAKYMQGITLEV
jgi:hypothetical protein